MSNDFIPIIKIEVSHVRECMARAFAQKSDEIQQMVKHSLEKYCTEEWLQTVVDDQVRRMLERAGKVDMGSSFEAADAIAKIIRDALVEKLSAKAPSGAVKSK